WARGSSTSRGGRTPNALPNCRTGNGRSSSGSCKAWKYRTAARFLPHHPARSCRGTERGILGVDERAVTSLTVEPEALPPVELGPVVHRTVDGAFDGRQGAGHGDSAVSTLAASSPHASRVKLRVASMPPGTGTTICTPPR